MLRTFLQGGLYFVFIGAVVFGWVTQKKKQSPPLEDAEALPELEKDATVLAQNLHHNDWRNRLAAARTLSELQDDSAIPALLTALDDADHDVREAAMIGLIARRKAAVPGLLEKLHYGDMNTRECAAKALEAIGDKKSLAGLLEALTDESSWVRLPVVRALGNMGDARIAPELTKLLQDTDVAVQTAAKEALEKIKSPNARTALKS